MTDHASRPDGEYFADDVQKPIPHQSTWADMSVNQLIEVKSELESKLWAFQSKPQIAQVLRKAIQTITSMIATATRPQ